MKRRLVLATIPALLIAACDRQVAVKDLPPAPQRAASSMPQLESQVKGFVAGQALSTKTVIVFFDTQCPHCARLWDAAKPLYASVRFIWVPVNVLGKLSLQQGATLLASDEPVAKMDVHEVALRQRGNRGMAVVKTDQTPVFEAHVQNNTKAFELLGARAVPHLVFRGADGSLRQQTGAMDSATLARFLGVSG